MHKGVDEAIFGSTIRLEDHMKRIESVMMKDVFESELLCV